MTTPPGTVQCKSCRKISGREGNRAPAGWLSLSVNVPVWVTTGREAPYLWIGLYCCVDCLEADIPATRAQERLAGWTQQEDAGQPYQPYQPGQPGIDEAQLHRALRGGRRIP